MNEIDELLLILEMEVNRLIALEVEMLAKLDPNCPLRKRYLTS